MEIDLGDTELQNNILKFGYGINYRYMGTISHSFDRFYVVTKFELPKVQDLQFTTIPYDKNCEHLEDAKSKGGLTLGIIASLITGFLGLAYEGISSFLCYRRQKALQKAVNVMKDKVDVQCNKIFHLEDSLVMYGVYNSDTLEDLKNSSQVT